MKYSAIGTVNEGCCCKNILNIMVWNFLEHCIKAVRQNNTLYGKFETNIPRPRIPNFCIHVSVSDLYIPTIGPPILLYLRLRTIVAI